MRRTHSLSRSNTALLIALALLSQPLLLTAQAQKKQKQPPQMSDARRVSHVLSRLTYGGRPGDFERVQAIGVEAFIKQQLDFEAIDDQALAAKLIRLPTLGMATTTIIEQYTPPKPLPSPSPNPAQAPALNSGAPAMPVEGQMEKKEMPGPGDQKPESMKAPEPSTGAAAPRPTPPPRNPQMVVSDLQRGKFLRAVYSERQLYEVMVDFWENHFSIFANKDADRYLLTSFDRDTIRPFAMGRFRDLLGATAHSPAMLYYLDNWRSSVLRPYPATKDRAAGADGGVNENYARELMELHTLGVDGGYTQKDVQEVARCFTGWTIHKPNEIGLFLYRPGLHDNGDKVVLGKKIPASGGIADGERVLDLLATHPSTARFIATKLARRFISDQPPPAVVDRAAAVFLKTDGSIRETLRAIITSPEFFSPAAYRAKLRSPLEYTVAAMRALNTQTDADRSVIDTIARMGQPLFGRITPDGYSDSADQWMSSGAMVTRFNFAGALATNRIKGTKLDLTALLAGTDQADRNAVAAKLRKLIVMDDLSDTTRGVLEKTLVSGTEGTGAPVSIGYSGDPGAVRPPASEAPVYIHELVTLLIGSPEFQKR